MLKPLKKIAWKIIHSTFKIKIFEKILLLFVKGRYVQSRIAGFIPPPYSYKNPTHRVAKKQSLRLYANLHDYNDWKAYWGLKEIERENLYALASDAKTVVDIGTNNGWVLMNLALIVKKNNGFVYGFEPHPDTYKRCMKNIEASGLTNCKVFNMGCSDSESELLMTTVEETNSGQNRIIDKEQLQTNGKNITGVKVTTLDKQLSNLDKVDMLKIDVEGFELHVLKGADNILTKNKPAIFIEINDPLLKMNNTSGKEVFDYLKIKLGYSCISATSKKAITDEDIFPNHQLDMICT